MKNKEFYQEKENLLATIKGNKLEYKRLSLSPIRYAGGKSLAVGHIIKHIPHVKRIVSPFFGGGSVEIALAKKLNIEIIAADINPHLVNYWEHQIKYPDKLYEVLKTLSPTKEAYLKIKKLCVRHKKNEIALTKLERAAYYFYNHNLSYGPSYIGWPSSVYLNDDRYGRMLEKVKNFNAAIKIKLCHFDKMFKNYPNDFFYCDPPYFLKEQDSSSQMFAGIYPDRNNPIYHNQFPHARLRDLLKTHQGGFILSYNDCTSSREYYKEYRHYYPKWQYTMGQGETRISKNLKNRKNSYVKDSHEILIVSEKR